MQHARKLFVRRNTAQSNSLNKRTHILAITVATGLALIYALRQPSVVHGQSAPPILVNVPFASLKTVPTPGPAAANLARFLRDRRAAIVLGKALFWDMQVGSDRQACASCHFNAGADSRAVNQLNPGFRAIPPDNNFSAPFGPNYHLAKSSFPFHKLADVNDHNSNMLFDTNDITSSQGVRSFTFTSITTGDAADVGIATLDPVFNVQGVDVRRVEPRNTPAVVNAVFNFRNFWDGRARNEFNGVTPIGDLDPTARVLFADTVAGTVQAIQLTGNFRLENSSLASQAVGPGLSDLEMSFAGRTFPKLGKKMLSLQPLALQLVAGDDSVLGVYTKFPLNGILLPYGDLIRQAFKPEWWQSEQIVQIDGTNPDGTLALTFLPPPPSGQALTDNQFRQIEFNFSLFWGLAIQMYEGTLRADDTPFDRFMEGDVNALTQAQKDGLALFQGKAKCIACHSGPEFTNASVQNVQNQKLERMIMGNDQGAVYDNGFYNTGVRRCAGLAGPCDDVGIGATIGPRNLPLSMSRFFQLPENIAQAPQPNAQPGTAPGPLLAGERVAVDGAFKTPGLRNVELTAPYFHNGGELTLKDTIDFYNRGGNFPEFNQLNLDPNIVSLGLTETEKLALVAFMRALTDERVRFERAPFDHPSLDIPNGASCLPASLLTAGVCTSIPAFTTDNGVKVANDDRIQIPQVGRHGRISPQATFEQLLLLP